jgi:putative DNA primase/helicase
MKTIERTKVPRAPLVIAGNIPEELKEKDQWVCWRYRRRGERWSKVPVSARTGRAVDITDASILSSFDEAFAAYQDRRHSGIGFVFCDSDPFTGVDLDDCLDPENESIRSPASEIIEELGSYAEVSPSGKGVKLIVRAALGPGFVTRRGSIEVYNKGRYFAITGNRLNRCPEEICDRGAELERLAKRYLSKNIRRGSSLKGRARDLTDEEIIEKAKNASNGRKFARLWAGDRTGYGSASDSDIALCSLLAFWTGADNERIERLFTMSALGQRPKWRNRRDYREATIGAALAGLCDYSGETLTRGTMTIQDYSRQNTINTVEGSPIVGVAPDLLSLAGELAESEAGKSVWMASFTLARSVRAFSESCPTSHREVVETFCARSGHDLEELWYAFLDSWDRVKNPQNVLTWAGEKAKAEPYALKKTLGDKYSLVASIAWHLSNRGGASDFWLPGERLAPLVGVSAQTVYRIVDLLIQQGVIKCVDENYSYANGKAKTYRFLGNPTVNEMEAS